MTPLEAAEALPFATDEAIARRYAARALAASALLKAAADEMRTAVPEALPELYEAARAACREVGRAIDAARAIVAAYQLDEEIAKNAHAVWEIATDNVRRAQAIYRERVKHAA